MCNLENFKFVAQGAAAAVVEVDADYASDDLLRIDKEMECWANNCIVHQEARIGESFVGFFLSSRCLLY